MLLLLYPQELYVVVGIVGVVVEAIVLVVVSAGVVVTVVTV